MAATSALPAPKRVIITPGSPPRVNPDPVTIRISGNDQVEWVCPSGDPFVVCFEHSAPFASHHFYPGQSVSGPIMVSPGGRKYKYVVEVGGNRVDPEVDVQN